MIVVLQRTIYGVDFEFFWIVEGIFVDSVVSRMLIRVTIFKHFWWAVVAYSRTG